MQLYLIIIPFKSQNQRSLRFQRTPLRYWLVETTGPQYFNPSNSNNQQHNHPISAFCLSSLQSKLGILMCPIISISNNMSNIWDNLSTKTCNKEGWDSASSFQPITSYPVTSYCNIGGKERTLVELVCKGIALLTTVTIIKYPNMNRVLPIKWGSCILTMYFDSVRK